MTLLQEKKADARVYMEGLTNYQILVYSIGIPIDLVHWGETKKPECLEHAHDARHPRFEGAR